MRVYNDYEATDSFHNPSDASRAERVCDKRDTSFRVTEAWSPQRDREARQVQTYRGAYLHLHQGSSKGPRWPRFKPSKAPLHANLVTQTNLPPTRTSTAPRRWPAYVTRAAFSSSFSGRRHCR